MADVDGDTGGAGAGPGQRLDRWLWFARFFKSRTLATKLCARHKVRVNRRIVAKASAIVRPGDVLTFPQGRHIRVVRILDSGLRRGPATEARKLYEDLAPPEPRRPDAPAPSQGLRREAGAGRPTKRERRAIDRLQEGGTAC